MQLTMNTACKTPTMADVARRACVAPMTVSRAFKSGIPASAIMRDSILRAARHPFRCAKARWRWALPETRADTAAVICVSGPSAFGALTDCERRGSAVPGRMWIAGFGGCGIAGHPVRPALPGIPGKAGCRWFAQGLS